MNNTIKNDILNHLKNIENSMNYIYSILDSGLLVEPDQKQLSTISSGCLSNIFEDSQKINSLFLDKIGLSNHGVKVSTHSMNRQIIKFIEKLNLQRVLRECGVR